MSDRYKVSRKKILPALACILLLLTVKLYAKHISYHFFFNSLTESCAADTVPARVKKPVVNASDTSKAPTEFRTYHENDDSVDVRRNDSLPVTDSLRKRTVTVTDTFKVSSDSLEGPVDYSAEDSGVIMIPTRQMYLYGRANMHYLDNNLEANTVEYDAKIPLFKAYGGTDTTTNDPLNKPKMTQGDQTSISDTIYFNPTTQKGRTVGTYFQEGEMYVHARVVKKVDARTLYARGADFTTCNLDTPHFAFHSNKIKIISNSMAYSGPTYPTIEGVPLPVPLPFGIFPLKRGRHSGLIAPEFATTEGYGVGLEGLGYYKVFSDNWDMTTRTNLYSYGTWMVSFSPRYFKRYKYSGNLNLSIQNSRILNSSANTKDEFTKSRTFNLTWSHSMDSKARPGVNFMASVNAGSTQFNRFVPNNPLANIQNNLSSTIQYSKTWNNGQYNLSVAGNHSQNSLDRRVDVGLPNLNFTVNTFYPFQRKEKIGDEKWYEKLGIGYNTQIQNHATFYDSAFSFRKIIDTLQYGARHSIPISLTLPATGPILISPSISYEETWYGQQVIRTWNDQLGKVDTSISKGVYTARQVSFGLSFNTRIFGTFNFPKSNGIKAIRHEIKPFVSINYKPDLAKSSYYDVRINQKGNTQRFSRYEGGIFGSYGEGAFGGMSFGIDNLFEMKVKDKKDTAATATKKVKLIDGLSINSAYNFFADSLKLSPIAISMRSTLFEKINITGNATLDPYQTDSFGRTINRFVWSDGRISPGRFTNANIAISTSLQSKSADGKKQEDRVQDDQYMTTDEQQAQLSYTRQNPGEFTDFNIPWSVQLGFSINFNRILKSDYSGYRTDVFSSLNMSGDFSLTPKWKIGGSTYLDVKTRQVQQLTMFVSREMHCWQLNINITPIGYYRSFNISMYPKSGILRDLKINRTRRFSPF